MVGRGSKTGRFLSTLLTDMDEAKTNDNTDENTRRFLDVFSGRTSEASPANGSHYGLNS